MLFINIQNFKYNWNETFRYTLMKKLKFIQISMTQFYLLLVMLKIKVRL